MDQAAEIIEVPQSPTIIETSNDPPVKPKSRAKIYFSFQDSIQLTEIPFLLLLFLGVLIFGMAVYPLGMLTLDYQGLLPAETAGFLTYLQQMTTMNGFLHPLGLLFNSGLYLIATQSYGLAHVILYAAHALTAVLLALLISRKYTRLESALLGLLFLSLPLFTGQYGWFAQANLTVAIFVLGLQLLIVQSTRLDLVVKSAILVFLQIVCILLHESMLFTFIPILIFLLPTEKPYFGGKHFRTFLLLSIPSITYLILKLFVIKPQSAGAFFSNDIVASISSFFNTVTSFFTRPGDYSAFWSSAFSDGLNFITHTDILILFVVCLIGLLIYELAVFFTNRFADGHVSSPLVNPLFWALLGVVTSIPYSPSALGFPLFCFLIAALQSIRLFSRRVGVIVACIVLLFCLPVSLGILDKMRAQAFTDNDHITSISETVKTATQGKTQTVVLIENPPEVTNLPSFNLYMQQCISLEKCISPAIVRQNRNVSAVYFRAIPQGVSAPTTPFIYDAQKNILIAK
jgi:hypothetical protein